MTTQSERQRPGKPEQRSETGSRMVAKGECLTPPLHEFVYLKFSEAVAVDTFPLVFPITGSHTLCFASGLTKANSRAQQISTPALYTSAVAAVRRRQDPLGWVDTFPSFSRKVSSLMGWGGLQFFTVQQTEHH